MICICVSVCAYGYSAQGVQNRSSYTEAGVRSSCEPLKWVPEPDLWSFAREAGTLNWVISANPNLTKFSCYKLCIFFSHISLVWLPFTFFIIWTICKIFSSSLVISKCFFFFSSKRLKKKQLIYFIKQSSCLTWWLRPVITLGSIRQESVSVLKPARITEWKAFYFNKPTPHKKSIF